MVSKDVVDWWSHANIDDVSIFHAKPEHEIVVHIPLFSLLQSDENHHPPWTLPRNPTGTSAYQCPRSLQALPVLCSFTQNSRTLAMLVQHEIPCRLAPFPVFLRSPDVDHVMSKSSEDISVLEGKVTCALWLTSVRQIVVCKPHTWWSFMMRVPPPMHVSIRQRESFFPTFLSPPKFVSERAKRCSFYAFQELLPFFRSSKWFKNTLFGHDGEYTAFEFGPILQKTSCWAVLRAPRTRNISRFLGWDL